MKRNTSLVISSQFWKILLPYEPVWVKHWLALAKQIPIFFFNEKSKAKRFEYFNKRCIICEANCLMRENWNGSTICKLLIQNKIYHLSNQISRNCFIKPCCHRKNGKSGLPKKKNRLPYRSDPDAINVVEDNTNGSCNNGSSNSK